MSAATVDFDQVRARIRAEAAAEGDGWYGWLAAADALKLTGVPRKVRKVRAVSGKAVQVRGDGGEHDALEILSESELSRLRGNGWLSHDGEQNADETLERLADMYGLAGIDAAWSDWLRATRIIDVCDSVRRGKVPGRWAREKGFAWWTVCAPGCELDGYDVRAIMERGEATEVVNRREQDAVPAGSAGPVWADALAEYRGRLVHGPKIDYVDALVKHFTAGGPEPEPPAKPWAPKVLSKVRRLCRPTMESETANA